MYIRAPTDGLPDAPSTLVVPPLALLKILKRAFGLAEAPRLWYVKATQQLELGMVELPYARSTFVRTRKEPHSRLQPTNRLHQPVNL